MRCERFADGEQGDETDEGGGGRRARGSDGLAPGFSESRDEIARTTKSIEHVRRTSDRSRAHAGHSRRDGFNDSGTDAAVGGVEYWTASGCRQSPSRCVISALIPLTISC